MSPPNIVLNVSDRQIYWPILVMPHSNRDGRLIASKNNWHKHQTLVAWVVGYDLILLGIISVR